MIGVVEYAWDKWTKMTEREDLKMFSVIRWIVDFADDKDSYDRNKVLQNNWQSYLTEHKRINKWVRTFCFSSSVTIGHKSKPWPQYTRYKNLCKLVRLTWKTSSKISRNCVETTEESKSHVVEIYRGDIPFMLRGILLLKQVYMIMVV